MTRVAESPRWELARKLRSFKRANRDPDRPDQWGMASGLRPYSDMAQKISPYANSFVERTINLHVNGGNFKLYIYRGATLYCSLSQYNYIRILAINTTAHTFF